METLKDIRLGRGMKQKAIAQKLGIARQTYASYEEHPEKMSYAQVMAVCNILRCEPGDFFVPEEVK